MNAVPQASRHDALRIACAAVLDRRTVIRYLDGRPVSATTALRIEEVLRAFGLASPRR